MDLDASSMVVVDEPLPKNVHVRIDGTASPQEITGVIGGPIPVATVLDYLSAEGVIVPPLALGAITFVADLDLDGDGSKDAFSAAFRFTAVTAADASHP